MRRLAPLLLAAALLAGCGTNDDREQARQTTERFYAAFRHHDGALACRQLTAAAAQQLSEEEKKPCPDAVTGLSLQGGRVVGVEVYITNAKVDLAEHVSTFLSRGPSGWKIDALSCAHDDKPADHPFNCELAS
jgi:hypothetical protein